MTAVFVRSTALNRRVIVLYLHYKYRFVTCVVLREVEGTVVVDFLDDDARHRVVIRLHSMWTFLTTLSELHYSRPFVGREAFLETTYSSKLDIYSS